VDSVDGVLHGLVIALALDRDGFPQIAVADESEDSIGLVDGRHDGVEHRVDSLDDLLVFTLMLRGVGSGGQISLDGGLGQRIGVGHQRQQVFHDASHGRRESIVFGTFSGAVAQFPVRIELREVAVRDVHERLDGVR